MIHPPFRRLASLLLLTLIAGLAGSSCARSDAVDFTLPDLDGQMRRLSEFRGKWVLVNYWATWCPPCLEELSELELFHNAHRERDAVVVGVDFEQIDLERLREFVEGQFISFPILRRLPAGETALGRVPGLPTSFLVAPDGRVVARRVGPITAQQVERSIEQFRDQYATRGEKK